MGDEVKKRASPLRGGGSARQRIANAAVLPLRYFFFVLRYLPYCP
jgi:hypothetical protein